MFSGEEQHSLENRLQILFEASATLIGAPRTEELLPKVLELARKLNAAAACAIWREDPETLVWRIASAVGLSSAFLEAGYTGGGMGEHPFCLEDVTRAPESLGRQALYAAEGIRSLVAMPMKLGGRVSGTLAFYYQEPHAFSETELRVAAALTSLAASAVETAELHREQELARVREAFLAEATAAFASSLDYQTTLAAVARLAVPRIADWCIVHIATPGGGIERLALAHADPDKLALATELNRRYPMNPNAPDGPPAVLRTGRSELYPRITDAAIERAAVNHEHSELLRTLGLTSYMCVPLAARGHILGTITFVSSATDRRYGPADRALPKTWRVARQWRSTMRCSMRPRIGSAPRWRRRSGRCGRTKSGSSLQWMPAGWESGTGTCGRDR